MGLIAVATVLLLPACQGSSGVDAEDTDGGPNALAREICENIEEEPSNQVAREAFEIDFERAVRDGVNETALSNALDEECGRLISALGPPLDTTERKALSDAERAAEYMCSSMEAEPSADLAYVEFEANVQRELAKEMDQAALYEALTAECGDLLSEIAPMFGPDTLVQASPDPGSGADGASGPPQGATPEAKPEETPGPATTQAPLTAPNDSFVTVEAGTSLTDGLDQSYVVAGAVLKNTSSLFAEWASVLVEIFDAQGNLLGAEEVQEQVGVPAGGLLPVQVSLAVDGTPTGTSVQTRVVEVAGWQANSGWSPPNANSKATIHKGSGYPSASGTVTNPWPYTLEDPRVFALFRDDNGDPVGGSSWEHLDGKLAPGEQRSVTVTWLATGNSEKRASSAEFFLLPGVGAFGEY